MTTASLANRSRDRYVRDDGLPLIAPNRQMIDGPWKERCNGRVIPGALYMAALVVTRRNPTILAFYQRLCQAGKAKKLALTACMRKLLTILNAMLTNGTPWRSPPVCPLILMTVADLKGLS